MLSQSVLLAGVNDDLDTLMALMRALVAARIKPYYLHHGDLAPGTAHFRTPISKGRALMQALREQASGLCQPTYVLDIPGGFGKVSLEGDNLTACAAGHDGAERYSVQDAAGRAHSYPDADKEEGTPS
jgi:lysine 2,3-aminomutase